MTTGERLKMLREQRGQSQAEIAKLIGVGRTTYLKYETGENKPTRKLKELSALFGVTGDYLLGLTDNPYGSMIGGPKDKVLRPVSPEEQALLEAYRKASDRDKDIIDTILKPSVRPKKEEVS